MSLCQYLFFNDPATTEIYTLSLHDALPIYQRATRRVRGRACRLSDRLADLTKTDYGTYAAPPDGDRRRAPDPRSEEHTSELQSQSNLVCRLLLEKKNTIHY